MSSTLNLLQYNHNIITNDTAETLSNSLDTDLANISETGKEYITPIGFPSSTYTTLSLGSSGASYTAPADGWVYFSKTTGGTSATYIRISSTTKGYAVEQRSYGSSTGNPTFIIPVCSGDTFTATYSATGSSTFRFYYATGAV